MSLLVCPRRLRWRWRSWSAGWHCCIGLAGGGPSLLDRRTRRPRPRPARSPATRPGRRLATPHPRRQGRGHRPVKTLSKKGKTIDAWYSGKTHDFGGNIQALTRPDGFPVWISPVEPGSVHDLTTARAHVLGALYAAASRGLPTLADPGYQGAGHGVHTPVKQPADGVELDINTRTRNALLRSLRCLGERGFALLTGRWRTLQHVTVSLSKISKIARAALVLTHFEHCYLPCTAAALRDLCSIPAGQGCVPAEVITSRCAIPAAQGVGAAL